VSVAQECDVGVSCGRGVVCGLVFRGRIGKELLCRMLWIHNILFM
jgi:hypothetical protein